MFQFARAGRRPGKLAICVLALCSLLSTANCGGGGVPPPGRPEPIGEQTSQSGPLSGGICDRTARVRDAIVALIPGARTCGEVTDAQLAAITGGLDLERAGLSSLRSGDFSGLTSLRGLVLSSNRLTALPADIFSGLPALRYLRLQDNELRSLPANLFSGLDELDILDLEYNELTELPSGLFDGLTLRFLGLEANRLQALPAALFDSLGGNLTLDLSDNELATLANGVFDNLRNLEFLDLANNELQGLPTGIFEGLTAMDSLYLEENPGADFTFTMTVVRVAATNRVAVVVPEGAPFDMTTTISATGGTLPDGVTTVTVPVGHTRSEEIAVTPLAGATVTLGEAPAVPPGFDGIATAVGAPLTSTSSNYARAADGGASSAGPNPAASERALRAWLGRFGRTVGEQVLDGVEVRMAAVRVPGAELSLAGRRIGDAAQVDGIVPFASRPVSGPEMLTGSSISLTAGTAAGGFRSVWGRGAVTRLTARTDGLGLDGNVLSGLAGVGWRRGPATAGLALAHSRGEGSYRAGGGTGGIESTLIGIYPYGRYALDDGLSVWGIAGYGAGRTRLRPAGGAALEAATALAMAAAGGRAVLLAAPRGAGPEFGAVLGVLAVRVSSNAARGDEIGPAATQAGVGAVPDRPRGDMARPGNRRRSFPAGLLVCVAA